jgi:hypothetical protein
MTRYPSESRKKAKLAFAVIAVGMTISTLVAVMLFFMGRAHPRF